MNQFARLTPECQAAPAPFSSLDVRLDVEVLADRHEALAALLTEWQFVLLKTRSCLERRLCAPTACDYGLATRVEEIDHELTRIETAKRREVPA